MVKNIDQNFNYHYQKKSYLDTNFNYQIRQLLVKLRTNLESNGISG